MYQHLRPQVAIPVHGEQRHLIHHTELALSCQVPEAVLVHNGAVVELTAKGSRIVGEVRAGRLVLDGDRIVNMESDVVRDRIKIMYNGTVSCSVVMDDEGELVADPKITAKGLIEDDDAAYDLAEAAADVRSYLGDLDADEAEDDAATEKAAHLALRRFFRSAYGKRPGDFDPRGAGLGEKVDLGWVTGSAVYFVIWWADPVHRSAVWRPPPGRRRMGPRFRRAAEIPHSDEDVDQHRACDGDFRHSVHHRFL